MKRITIAAVLIMFKDRVTISSCSANTELDVTGKGEEETQTLKR
jgi:hypothetical protein